MSATSSVAARMAQADPTRSVPRHELDVLNGLADSSIQETNRELAAAGLGTPSQAVAAKAFAGSMQLRPDVPFMDQLAPEYAGPTVRRDGIPVSPFNELSNAELDKQRRTVEQLKGPNGREAMVAEVEAQHAARW